MQRVKKHPVSIALSKRILDRIDQEAEKQKRSRSDWVEMYFEDFFFKESKTEVALKLG
jgi:metal-responsive CopG/Arc/MetJ family transcriptional regulator